MTFKKSIWVGKH